MVIVYPNQFGYHTDTYKYCQYLNDSFKVTYIGFDQGFERIEQPQIEVEYLSYNIGSVKRIYNYLKFIVQYTHRLDINVLFVVQFKFCFILAIFCRAPVKILDFRSGSLSESKIKRKIQNYLLWFDSIFFKNITVISEGLGKILGLKRDTLILPLGSDIISSSGRRFDHLDLLYVGSLSNRKIHETIEGISILKNKHREILSQITYTIVGFGKNSDTEKITDVIESHSLTDIVRLVGRIKYPDLKCYFDSCNVGITYVPVTAFYEFQPVTKLFEYLLSGMPVIATNTYENRLIVKEENGVLINDTPDDFCNGLITIYNKRKEFNSDEIRKTVENHTWQKIVKNILEPYLSGLLNASPKN